MDTREKEIEELEQADLNCLWHPFTQMQVYRREKPVIIEKGKGSYLYDIEGNVYLDGISSLWTNVHGHGKAELDAALKEPDRPDRPFHAAGDLQRSGHPVCREAPRQSFRRGSPRSFTPTADPPPWKSP